MSAKIAPLPKSVRLPSGPAPHLRWHMRVRLLTYPDARHVQMEAAELRAVLAVVRAARAHRPSPDDEKNRKCPTCVALARLDRVSQRGKGKGRR